MALEMETETNTGNIGANAAVYGTARNPVPTAVAEPAREKSLGELFADLSRESSALIRHEVSLAKAELGQKAAKIGKDAGMIAAGGVLALGGFLTLLAAITLMLVQLAGMPAWGAALLVAAVVLIGGGVLAMNGLNSLKSIDPTPHQTVETLKEDAQWAKQQI